MFSFRHKKIFYISTLLFSLCIYGQSSSALFDDSSVESSQEIKVRQIKPSGKITGYLPPSRQVQRLSQRFFQTIKIFPKNFLKESGIRYVTFLSKPRLKGVQVGGLALKEKQTIYLSTTFTAKTVYHEIYHVFDPSRKNEDWCSLNAHNFIYVGSKYYSENLSKTQSQKARKNIRKMTFDADFVSRYAMSNEEEDRAETFAYMMVEGRSFLRRTQRSHVLKKKMDYIIQITTENNTLSASFWKRHLGK